MIQKTVEDQIEYEKAIRMLMQYMPKSEAGSRKPIAFHDIRVGVLLYNRGFGRDVVVAGILHDMIEWSDATRDMVREEFGENVIRLVLASTKDDSIEDRYERIRDMIRRCVAEGEEALAIKAADVLDSFVWYESQQNEGELKYCVRNATAIAEYRPEHFRNEIFDEIEAWRKNYAHLFEG